MKTRISIFGVAIPPIAWLIVALLAVGLRPVGSSAQDARSWTAAAESRVLVAGDGDSFLLEPIMLAMGQGIVAVFDRGDMSLKGIDRGAGRLLWTLGRAGSGPWEFAQVMDVAVGPADSVWVLDLENRRIYVAGPNGSKGRVVNLADALAGSRLGSANPYRIALLPDGIALGMDRAENGDLVALLSWEGRHRGGIEGPAWIRELPWLAADYNLGGDFAKGGLGLAFVYTGRILAVADDADPPGLREIEAIETRGEPEIVRFTFMGMDASRFAPGQVRFARDVAVQDERIAVLTARRDGEDRVPDVIDLYAKGEYERSVRLPHGAREIAMRRNVVAVLEVDLFPAIRELTLP